MMCAQMHAARSCWPSTRFSLHRGGGGKKKRPRASLTIRRLQNERHRRRRGASGALAAFELRANFLRRRLRFAA